MDMWFEPFATAPDQVSTRYATWYNPAHSYGHSTELDTETDTFQL